MKQILLQFEYLKKFLTPTIISIFVIFLFGTFLRFHDLSTNPPSLNWDEVAFGYNAHSIIETGRDEFGKYYPVYFRSLDDYKLPVYMYLTVISEKTFGYNNFAIRFPSAFFGSLTILLIFLLSKFLTKSNSIALISSLLLAILPWHIQFSRMAAESTVGLFLFLAGLLLFLYSTKEKLWLLPLSFLLFALAQYTYLSFRFFIPLYLVVSCVLHYKYLCKKNAYVYITCFLVIIFYLLLGFDSYTNKNSSRTSGIAAVTTISDQYQLDSTELIYDGKLGINIPRRVFHDSHIFSTMDILMSNYLSHFSPLFLFFNQNQARHYTPMFGLLYLWMLPFMLIGMYVLCQKYTKSTMILFALLLLAPLPAAFAFDSPNAIRTITMTIPACILAAFGIYTFGKYSYASRKIFLGYSVTLTALVLFSFFHFYHENSIHLPQERSKDWQFGRQEMTQYLLQHKNHYHKIIVNTNLEWPNIFYLYYSRYDPKRYLQNGGTINGSWDAKQNKIDNIEFYPFHFPKEGREKNVLLVGKPDDFPNTVNPIHIISYLDGSPAIYFVESTPNLKPTQNLLR
jgi:4-amino-4-deoxy-L-arabinose transferase-like glycosyltransferase